MVKKPAPFGAGQVPAGTGQIDIPIYDGVCLHIIPNTNELVFDLQSTVALSSTEIKYMVMKRL